MPNIFEEFISILTSDVEEYLCSTRVIVEVIGDIVYLGSSCG
jgi:hypothetical protein